MRRRVRRIFSIANEKYKNYLQYILDKFDDVIYNLHCQEESL